MNKINNKIKKMLGKSNKENSLNFSFSDILKNNKPKNNLFKNDLFKNRLPKNSLFKNGLPKNSLFKNNLFKNSLLNKQGAPLQLQLKWSSFSKNKQNFLRQIYIDTDKDKVPDKYDCEPLNPKKQDKRILEFFGNWLKYIGEIKKQIESHGAKVTSARYYYFDATEIFPKFNEVLEFLGGDKYGPHDDDLMGLLDGPLPFDIFVTIPKNLLLYKTLSEMKIYDDGELITGNFSKLRYEQSYGWFLDQKSGNNYNNLSYIGGLIVDKNGRPIRDMSVFTNPDIKVVDL